MKQVFIRKYEKGDEENIIDFLKNLFERYPNYDLECDHISYWRWKFLKNSFKKNFIVIAESNNNIIGCYHAIPLNIKIGERIYHSAFSTDGAVHPDYRRIGVFNKMRQFLVKLITNENVAFLFHVSNNPIFIEQRKRKKYGYLPYLTYKHVRIKNIILHRIHNKQTSLFKLFVYNIMKNYYNIKTKFFDIKHMKYYKNIKIINKFDDRIDVFWDKIKNEYNFIIERKKEYLNWRYCDPCGGKYIIMQAEEDKNIIGYIILRINKHNKNYPVGYIVDLITYSNKNNTSYELLNKAVNYLDKKNVNIIYWQILNNHPHQHISSKLGFINSRFINHMTYSRDCIKIGYDEKILQESSPKQIHFVYGDYDWI